MSSRDDGETGELGPPEYLVYRVLDEKDRQDDRETSRTRIHKLCSLADRLLKAEFDRDVGLPLYWYKYGRTIQESAIDTAVVFGPRANRFDGRAYYPADQVSESDFEHLPEALKDDVFQAARTIVEEYGHLNAEELEAVQYRNHAPDDFVKAYGDLRWHLAAISEDEAQSTFSEFVPAEEKTRTEELLDEMLVAFDDEEYGDVHDLYLEWDDTMRLLNQQGSSPRELLEFTEMFVEGVAKIVLRLTENTNVPAEKRSEWRERSAETRADLRRKIERKRESALSRRRDAGSLDAVSESYNESISDELDDL